MLPRRMPPAALNDSSSIGAVAGASSHCPSPSPLAAGPTGRWVLQHHSVPASPCPHRADQKVDAPTPHPEPSAPARGPAFQSHCPRGQPAQREQTQQVTRMHPATRAP